MEYKNLILLAPEIFLSILAMVFVVWEGFAPHSRKPFIYAAIAGLVGAILFISSIFFSNALPFATQLGIEPIKVLNGWIQYPPLFNMLAVDSLALFFKIAVIISAILVLWISNDYYEFENVSMGTYCSLILFATVGMMLLVGSVDLLMVVISLELISIPSFILTGYILKRKSSGEGALKFFLVGTFSTAILLFGISYYYGYFGTTHINALLEFSQTAGRPDMPLSLLLMFLVGGIGFKLAMVPFHMWAPDSYEGAPTPVTALLSVAPKAAAIGFLLRFLLIHSALEFTLVLAVLAAITMTVGNVGALHQTNIKRLMAYSSIAQVGYILVAVVAGGNLGALAAMVYTFLYLFMNLGIFSILIIVANNSRSEEITVFAGLSRKSLALSLMLVVFLLSLTGIPPLAGFVGKFAIFAAVIEKKGLLLWLGIVAVLNSVVSLYYYFRIAKEAFFSEEKSTPSPLTLSPALLSCLLVSLGITLLVGLAPNSLLGWVRNVVGS